MKQLTSEAFSPYGAYLAKPAAAPADSGGFHQYWHRIAMEHFGGEPLTLGYLHIERHEPLVREMERHERFAELFITVQGSGILPVARRGCVPSAQNVEFFHLKEGDAVLLDPDTWHKLPVPDAESIGFLMVLPEDILQDNHKHQLRPSLPLPV